MAGKKLHKDILLYLHKQVSDDKIPLPELCKELGASQERIIDALDWLENQGYVGTKRLERYAVLCWITYSGRQMVKQFAGQETARGSTEEERSQIDYHEPDTDVLKGYPAFTWDLSNLDPQYIPIVQRQEVIERIANTLEDPSGQRIVFLYGQPRVGKTFVLERLKEILQDQYVPVFVHMNGWSSTRKQLDFLRELAANIQIEIESSVTELPIEPFSQVSELQATAEFSKWMHDLARSMCAEGKPFLLMFDELEYLAREEADGRIFEYLTGFIDAFSQRVRFVFAGSGDMLDLLQNNALLTKLLSKGHSVYVDCFDEKTSRDLAVALVAPYFTFERRALDRVVHLADGHPCLLKKVLSIIVCHWRNKWQREEITEDDLIAITEDICMELSPTLKDIWHRLSLLEKLILQRAARHKKGSFRARDVVVGQKYHVERTLKKLTKRQILEYDSQNDQYTIRLGLLIDSISHGILSVGE